MKSYFVFLLYTAGILSDFACSSEVPMVFWNIKGSSLHLRPVSAFEVSTKKSMENLFEETLSDGATSMIVFLVDRLSMEDFSVEPNSDSSNNTLKKLESFLDKQPHMLLPAVKGPVKQLRTLPSCTAEDIYVDQNVDEKVKKSIASAIDRSCVVFVHLPNFGIVSGKASDEISQVFQPAHKTKKNIVGVFTAQKSSWDLAGDKHHRTRSLLAVEAVSSDHFMNFTDCIIMYAESVVVNMNDIENNTMELPFPPALDGSSCENSSSVLQLTFGAAGVNISGVVLKFEFESERGYWYLANGTVTIKRTGSEDFEEEYFKSSRIEAPIGFSYSCGTFSLSPGNKTDVLVTIKGFQIQPYKVKGVFAESFDCVPFFTLPIWMGIIVAVLFIIIINSGVYALFAIKTMDRFDDPKGKTISVPLGAE